MITNLGIQPGKALKMPKKQRPEPDFWTSDRKCRRYIYVYSSNLQNQGFLFWKNS